MYVTAWVSRCLYILKNVYKSVYRLYGVSNSDQIEQLLDTVSSVRVELSHQNQMIEVDRPTFFKAQHSREFSGMDVSTSMIRSFVFPGQSSARSLYEY